MTTGEAPWRFACLLALAVTAMAPAHAGDLGVAEVAAAVAARDEGITGMAFEYEARTGTIDEFDLGAVASIGDVEKRVSLMRDARSSQGSVRFNNKRKLVWFSQDTRDEKGRPDHREAWCDLRSGQAKYLWSGAAHGPAIGKVDSAPPAEWCGAGAPFLTPLAFSHWPFARLTGAGAMMKATALLTVSPDTLSGRRTQRVEMLSREMPATNGGAEARIAYRLWLAPDEELLPVRRDVLSLDRRQVQGMPTFGARPGMTLEEFWRTAPADALAMAKGRTADYAMDTDYTIVPKVEVQFRGAHIAVSFWILSTGRTATGAAYPADMVRISRGGYDPSARAFLAERITVKSCADLDENALTDWDFPVGVFVRDDISDARYKMGISPASYMKEAKVHVEEVKRYQRGEVELPRLKAPPPEPAVQDQTRAAPDRQSRGGLAAGILIAAAATLSALFLFLLLRRRAAAK
jgi:hypothetical protein